MKDLDSMVMVGGPDSGKTNYLARLWESLRGGQGRLRGTESADDIRYVVAALSHLLGGKFAPRTETNGSSQERGCSLKVVWAREEGTQHASLLVPDVSGELWEEALETYELPEEWMAAVRKSIGALLFVRVASSLNRPSLDWATSRKLLQLDGTAEDQKRLSGVQVPTDVQLCEFLRFLEFSLGKDAGVQRPRVAIMVTAWDIVDQERAKRGLLSYLNEEYPLFTGRIADVSKIEVVVFGVSVVGGDFEDEKFRTRFQNGEIRDFGYIETEAGSHSPNGDVTPPICWILDCDKRR